jgi:hypothetical protein
MAVHVALQAGIVAQEAGMADLVQLVGADGALAGAGQASAGQRDLWRLVEAKTKARAGRRAAEVGCYICRLGQVVDGIGVVPEQAEVGTGISRPAAGSPRPNTLRRWGWSISARTTCP